MLDSLSCMLYGDTMLEAFCIFLCLSRVFPRAAYGPELYIPLAAP